MDFPFFELSLFCGRCGAIQIVNLVQIPTHLNCPKCDGSIYSVRHIKGAIYITSNESMPGLFKVGMTTRNVEDRISELSSATGVPTPFTLECLVLSDAPERDETVIHLQLASYRVQNKEFFKAKRAKLIEICQEVCRRKAKYVRQLPEPKPLDAVIHKGSYYCPKCDKRMRKLPSNRGWACLGCSIYVNKQGRGYRH